MTREQLQKHWKIIEAFKDGKEIEFKDEIDSRWHKAGEPLFRINREYRVIPEPLEYWVNRYSDPYYYSKEHLTPEAAIKAAAKNAIRVAVHMKEVVE